MRRTSPSERSRFIGCFLLLGSILSACSSGPPPKRYLLAVPDVAPNESVQRRIALQRVGVPGYLEGDRIASEASGAQVVFDEDDRWAEEPRVAITRALQNILAAEPGVVVLAEPWPRRFEPDVRVKIDFDRLLRTEGGGVSMSGNYVVMQGAGENVVAIRPFAIQTAGTGSSADDYGPFFTATSEALTTLARDMLDTLPTSGDDPQS